MATIRANCNRCGDVEFPTSALTLHVSSELAPGSYLFRCPECQATVVREASGPVIDLLIAAGVRWESIDGPLTAEEVDEFQKLINNDAALEKALGAISDQ